MIQTNDLITN